MRIRRPSPRRLPNSSSSRRNKPLKSKRWPPRLFPPTTHQGPARRTSSISSIAALTSFDREQQHVYTQGLQDLQSKTREQFSGAAKFSGLTSAQQIQLLTGIERTPFFALVRTHTIVGFFANPEYGGNYEKVGWRLIGFEDTFSFQPPFGAYDRDAKQGA